MAGKPGPETKLVKKMRDAGRAKYGERLVDIKYHGEAMAEAGVSDLLMCLDGVFVAVEVKAPDNYKTRGVPDVDKACEKGPTVKQRLFTARVLRAGGCAGYAASVEQFMEILAHAEDMHDIETLGWMCKGHNC